MREERYVYEIVQRDTGRTRRGGSKGNSIYVKKPSNHVIASVAGFIYETKEERDAIIAEKYKVKKYKLVEVEED